MKYRLENFNNAPWTKEEKEKLYDLKVNQNLSFSEIGKEIGKTASSCGNKYRRTNWKHFFAESKDQFYNNNKRVGQDWTQEQMIQLYTYLDAGLSYGKIAEKMDRSGQAVGRKCQNTNWEAWHEAFVNPEKEDELIEDDSDFVQHLVNSLVSIGRYNYDRIKDLKKDDFLEKINLTSKELPRTFTELRDLAFEQLNNDGLGNKEHLELGEGSYVIVGDSHGKHTKRRMFDLINNVSDFVKAKKVIHLGHILDDDDDISFKWGDISNLIVVAKEEELREVHKMRNTHDFGYEIVRDDIQLGSDLSVTNQEVYTDYSRTPVRNLDSEVFDSKTIVNSHRMETASKAASDGEHNYFASPGCICERHIVKTVKICSFKDGMKRRETHPEGYIKYRRMKHNYKYWSQGIIVVNVDKNGNHTIYPCLIRKEGVEYYTSYFDKIISSKGVHDPDRKILVSADMHAPSHDANVLDVQEQIAKAYKPDVMVNIGDAFDANAINHHDIDRGHVVFGDFLKEAAQTHFIMKRMKGWAPEVHAIVGNHERFIQDFVKKFPQLGSILDFEFVCDLQNLGYKITSLKEVLEIGDAKFIHGDMIFFNQTGNKLEKASRTLGHNVFIGHIHYPSIRFGCYSVGFSGKMDQGYNEPKASAWIHGIGLCNQYKGMTFPTTLAIFDYNVVIGKKTFKPKDPESWNIDTYKARIVYETDGNKKSNS